jgi:hypothetical protein
MFSSVFQCNDRSKDPVKFEATPYSNTGKNWIKRPIKLQDSRWPSPDFRWQ